MTDLLSANEFERPIKDWPKIDLHRHLEGAVRTATFKDIVREYKIELPKGEYLGIRDNICICSGDEKSLTAFLKKFVWLRKLFVNKEALARITYEAVEDAARDNVIYLELRFNPARMFDCGLSHSDVIDGINEGIRLAKAKYRINVGLICGIARDMEYSFASETIAFAVKNMDKGILAMDIMGNEKSSPKEFSRLIKEAAKAGLPATVHAGEAGPAENIIESINELGAVRIGHGSHILENKTALELVKEKNVLIEACLTSNVQTGAVKDMVSHPLKTLLAENVPVCLNTDDPGVSGCLDLSGEFYTAKSVFSLDFEDLIKMLMTGAEHIFDINSRDTIKRDIKNYFKI